jgi:N-acetylglucosamine-6-phosphate deacetylase
MAMNCFGVNPATGSVVEVKFSETIAEVAPSREQPLHFLAPGFIDMQVNGFAGVDYNNPATPHEAIARSLQVLFSTGVTRFYPTVITGSPEDMAGALANLAAAREKLSEGDAIEGFHVEGPHISPDDGPRGAHPRRWVRPPDIEEFQRWQDAARGHVRLVTVSPEWPEVSHYIEALVNAGVVVSIGHTKATAQQIQQAVSAGATMSTHLGNGAHPVLPRHPNYIWEQLADDRLAAGFIVDGIHLPGPFLKVALRAKGLERSVLVTDAATPACSTPGRYKLGEQEVDLTADGRVVLAGQDRLAGSALRMDRGVANLMRLAGLTLAQAIQMATTTPARIGRISFRLNGIVPGDRADLVQFRLDPADGSIRIEKTVLAGKIVYTAA